MPETMFEHVGGEETLRKLASAFHHAVMDDPLLAPLFAYSGPRHAENLTKYFTEVFSGPALFTEELGGFEYIKNRHARLRITEEQRTRFVELMLRAGEEVGLPTDERFQTAWRTWVDRAAGFSMKASHLTDEQLAAVHSSLGRWDW
jgi:hemoglobin